MVGEEEGGLLVTEVHDGQLPHRAEPATHQLWIGGRVDATAVLGEERALRDHVEAGEQGQALIEDVGHDVAVTARSEQLQSQQRTKRVLRRDHVGTWRPRRRPCTGHIEYRLWADERITWSCPECGDNGVISNWQSTQWDRRRLRPTH